MRGARGSRGGSAPAPKRTLRGHSHSASSFDGGHLGALDGKVAVVTGGAAGIGKGFALALAEAGGAVAICDIQPKVEGVAEEIAGRTGRRV
ncbi:MAG: SDR family NAD(P)-dependent oxidoreductase, partial [Dehalococcoidia bacterium]